MNATSMLRTDPRPAESFVQKTGTESEGASLGRILLVAPEPFLENRGTPIAIEQVLRALTQLGYGVDVVTYPMGRTPAIPRLRVFRCANPFGLRHVPIGFSLRKVLLDLFLTELLWRRLRHHQYVCIHAVEEAAFPALFLGHRARLPVIYDMQSSLAEQLGRLLPFRSRLARSWLARCERWLVRNADWIVASAGLAHRVREIDPSARVQEWQFSSALLPVDGDEVARLRRELGLEDSSRVILYTGTFEPYQGLSTLLAAVPLVRQRVAEAVFVLVGGNAKDLREIGTRHTALLREGALRLVLRQSRDSIPAYLAMAEVMVSPRAWGSNLPLKIFDYLAAGKPIVATDIAAHRSILDESRARLVPASRESVAAGILELLAHPEQADRLTRAARRYAGEHLDALTFVQSVGALYREVATSAPPS